MQHQQYHNAPKYWNMDLILDNFWSLALKIAPLKQCYAGDRQMDDLPFYVLFNSISVISGHWVADFEKLCAMEPCLQSKRPPVQVGFEPRLLDP